MTDRPIFSIEIDDSAFADFAEKYAEYQRALESMPRHWAEAGKETKAQASQFEKLHLSIRGQIENAEKVAKGAKETSANASMADLAWAGIAFGSKQFHANILGATLRLAKWSTLTGLFAGLVGAGGLYGINRMASSVAQRRSDALSLGVSYGERQAAGVNLGRIGDVSGLLSGYSTALNDQSQRAPLWGLFKNPDQQLAGKDAAGALVESLPEIGRLVDNTPTGMLRNALGPGGRNLGALGWTPEMLQLYKSMSPGERKQIIENYKEDQKTLDIQKQVSREWSDFITTMERSGTSIENVLRDNLVNITRGLTDLSIAFVGLTKTLLEDGGPAEKWLKELNVGFTHFAAYLKTPEFTASIGDFVKNIDRIAHIIDKIVLSKNPQTAALLGIGAAAAFLGRGAVAAGAWIARSGAVEAAGAVAAGAARTAPELAAGAAIAEMAKPVPGMPAEESEAGRQEIIKDPRAVSLGAGKWSVIGNDGKRNVITEKDSAPKIASPESKSAPKTAPQPQIKPETPAPPAPSSQMASPPTPSTSGFNDKVLNPAKPIIVPPQQPQAAGTNYDPKPLPVVHGDVSNVDPALLKAVAAGAEHLKPGYHAEIFSGMRGNNPGSQHYRGEAIDVQIRDPQGNLIPSKGADTTGSYGRLAKGTYEELQKHRPDLAEHLRHGSSFETSAGSGVPDIMHLDFGGGEREVIDGRRVGGAPRGGAFHGPGFEPPIQERSPLPKNEQDIPTPEPVQPHVERHEHPMQDYKKIYDGPNPAHPQLQGHSSGVKVQDQTDGSVHVDTTSHYVGPITTPTGTPKSSGSSTTPNSSSGDMHPIRGKIKDMNLGHNKSSGEEDTLKADKIAHARMDILRGHTPTHLHPNLGRDLQMRKAMRHDYDRKIKEQDQKELWKEQGEANYDAGKKDFDFGKGEIDRSHNQDPKILPGHDVGKHRKGEQDPAWSPRWHSSDSGGNVIREDKFPSRHNQPRMHNISGKPSDLQNSPSRNLNPGNLQHGKFATEHGGIGPEILPSGKPGRFERFPTAEAGTKAQSDLLFETKKYGNKTIPEMARTYAPPKENRTGVYTKGLMRGLGDVRTGIKLNELNQAQRSTLIKNQQRLEGFKPDQPREPSGRQSSSVPLNI